MVDCLRCRRDPPPNAVPGGTWERYHGKWVYVEQNSRAGYVAMTNRHGGSVFFAQGEEAEPYLDMTAKEFLDDIDSAGVVDNG